jgi:hypothetical protein
MSISRSRSCIHSSCGGHSSSPSRNRDDCPFHRRSEAVGRVVDRWMACIFAANHAKRGLVPSQRIDCGDRSLPRVRRRRAVRRGPGWRARYCSVHRLAARRTMRAGPVPENFMKKLSKRVRPPWGDDMEEALRAQYEALRRQAVSSPSGRWSSRSDYSSSWA